MLSDWNPTYTAQLGAEISIAKNKADVNLLYVTTVAVCCSTNLIVTGRPTAFLYTNLLNLNSFFFRYIFHERPYSNEYPCSRTPLLLVYWYSLLVSPHNLHNTFIGPSLVEAVKAATFLGLAWFL